MLSNKILDDRYTILDRVGGGGMADVYLAHDELLDRSVAVKVLRSQYTDDEDFVLRFRREAQAAARLSHPNIVNIYDVGRDENIYYIVMEYIAGNTLKDLIKKSNIIPVTRAVNIAIEIAEALEHAHQNGLIHCDIKPHNILNTKSGRIKVTDFGIARAVSSSTLTQTGTIIGSVHYLAPEQAHGGIVGVKSDIYSLGVVMYEMLTGKLPFNGDTPISVAIKHLQEEPEAITSINPLVPPLLEAVVNKAMAKKPEDRYSDITELIKDLKVVLNYLASNDERLNAPDQFATQLLPEIKSKDLHKKDYQSDKSPLSNKNIAIILTLLLIVGFFIGAFFAYGKFWSLSEIPVPNVVGKYKDDAEKILLEKNLRLSITESYNTDVPLGYIISQTPSAGAIVKEQRLINLNVSKGGEMVLVPDIRNIQKRDAEVQLRSTGLVIGKIEEQYSNNHPQDTIINQNPRPPAQILKGSSIDIVISKGVEPKKVGVPDFRGSPIATVTRQLDSLKLKVGKITEVYSDRYPPGLIVDQNPAPASEVNEDSTIDFFVSKTSSSDSIKRASVQITVPDGPANQSVQIVITDKNGRRVVYDGQHKTGEKIERTVEGTGSTKIQVFVNGILLQEQSL